MAIAAIALFAAAIPLTLWFVQGSQGRRDDTAWARAGVALLVAGCALNLVVALVFVTNQPDDFGIYYRCGLQSGAAGAIRLEACRSIYSDLGTVFWTRSAFYTFPIGLLFGESYLALRLSNAALQSGFLLGIWWLARSRIGPRAPVLALPLAILSPERLHAIPLATSDNLALPLLALGFLLIVRLAERTRLRDAVLLIPALALLIAVLNPARSVGHFLLFAGLAAILLAGQARFLARLAMAAGLVVAVVLAGGLVASAIGHVSSGSWILWLMAALEVSTGSPGLFIYQWYEHFWPQVPEAERAAVAWARFTQELAEHGDLVPRMLWRKAIELGGGSGYAFFSTLSPEANLHGLRLVAASNVPAPLPAWPYRLASVPLLLLALLGALRAARGPLAVAAVAFITIFAVATLGFFVVQPRYILPILPALVLLAALPAASDPAPVRWRGPALAGLGLAGLFVAGLLAIRATTVLPVANLAPETALPGCAAAAPLRIEGTRQRRVVTFDGPICLRIPVAETARALEIFVGDNRFPFLNEPRGGARFSFSAEGATPGTGPQRLEDRNIRLLRLPLDPARWREGVILRITPDPGAPVPLQVLVGHALIR